MPNTQIGPLTAKLNWRTGMGNEHTAYLDVGKGIQFAIMASEARLVMINEANSNRRSLPQDAITAGFASIGAGVSQRFTPLTKTVWVWTNGQGVLDVPMANGVTQILEYELPQAPLQCVPPFAKSVRLQRCRIAPGTGAGSCRIAFYWTLVKVAEYELIANEDREILLPGCFDRIEVTNTDLNTQTIIPQFALAL
jgi:hypothetical protein